MIAANLIENRPNYDVLNCNPWNEILIPSSEGVRNSASRVREAISTYARSLRMPRVRTSRLLAGLGGLMLFGATFVPALADTVVPNQTNGCDTRNGFEKLAEQLEGGDFSQKTLATRIRDCAGPEFRTTLAPTEATPYSRNAILQQTQTGWNFYFIDTQEVGFTDAGDCYEQGRNYQLTHFDGSCLPKINGARLEVGQVSVGQSREVTPGQTVVDGQVIPANAQVIHARVGDAIQPQPGQRVIIIQG